MKEAAQSPYLARFESFEVNLWAGELRKNGARIKLPEQSFQILAMLLERPGEVVTRQAIQKKLWPNDTVVEFENSINAAIKKLRGALGDSADQPRYIGTLARRGYRWKVPVEWVEPPPEKPQTPAAVAGPVDSSAPHLIGKRVSHYRVLEVLGGGGMGVVYKAEDIKLGRRVALKFLPEELVNDAKAIQRFECEARAASALNHPNICTIYEVEEHEGQPFIVMELLEGQTLRELIYAGNASGQRFLPLQELLKIAIQTVGGLEAAHLKGVIHRDIKPANIFVMTNGQVKILDFGLAKLWESDSVVVRSPVSDADVPTKGMNLNLTLTGVAMGTAGYMSPEQVRGEKLDARTDLFSFGLVLYEMAAGQRAFSGETAPAVRSAILKERPQPVRDLNLKIPPKLEGIINRALEKDRELRYQSASETRTDLARLKREIDSGRDAIAEPPAGSEFSPTAPAPAALWSSSRAAEAGEAVPKKRRWPLMAGAIVVVVAALAVGSYFLTRSAPRVTSKDPIIVADFTNTTGDPVFDGTLRQGLASQLEQSPYLDILSDEQIAGTLRLMGQPAGARLTHELARQACQRSGGTAVLDGSIAQIGSQYNLVLNAVNCSTGAWLASAQAVASDKNHVLETLGNVASSIRAKLGESLASIQKLNTPLEDVTTPSLEALQAYTLGWRAMLNGDPSAAVAPLQRAISLDPNFAMAYAVLGTAYWGLGESRLAAKNTRKAYDLRERLSEREKFYISSHYEENVTADLEKAVQLFELWAETYPRDVVPVGHLGYDNAILGQHDKSLAAARRALDLAPDDKMPYEVLVSGYLNLNRLDEAAAILQQAKARGIELPGAAYEIAFLRGDAAGMARETGSLRTGDSLTDLQAGTAAFGGHLAQAKDLTVHAVAFAEHAGEKESAAGYMARAALCEALAGVARQARTDALSAVQSSDARDTQAVAALALALVGDITQAHKLADDLAKRFPQDTIAKFHYLPTIRAAIALGEKSPAKAIADLQVTFPYELGATSLALYPLYIRGKAYLVWHQGVAAAAEFQKILDHRGLALNEVIIPLAHLGLGRARALSADHPSARKAYQDFFALWQHADPNLPILQQAKAEFARLR